MYGISGGELCLRQAMTSWHLPVVVEGRSRCALFAGWRLLRFRLRRLFSMVNRKRGRTHLAGNNCNPQRCLRSWDCCRWVYSKVFSYIRHGWLPNGDMERVRGGCLFLLERETRFFTESCVRLGCGIGSRYRVAQHTLHLSHFLFLLFSNCKTKQP